MGFRFRKSFGSGPFRINVSKSGIGYSIGGKGFRYTKKAGGGIRTTMSIPGTGISYVKDHSEKKRGSTMKQTRKNPSPSAAPQLQSQTLRVSGLHMFVDNLKKLAKLNPDWKLSPEEILVAGKDGQKIFQCKFSNTPLELIPDPDYEEDPDAVAVLIAGCQVGYIENSASAQVRKLLKTGSIKSISCGIFGGKYKIVDETGAVSVQSSPINIAVKVTYFAENATKSAASKPSKQTKKKKAKKPFFKRWWFWAFILLLLFNSCNGGSETPPVETEPTTNTTASIEASSYPETEAIETTVPVTEAEPSTEPTVDTTPEIAAIVPVNTDETELPTDTPDTELSETEPSETEPSETEKRSIHYVLNTNTKKFHYEGCSAEKKIKDKNREDFYGTRDEVIARGYDSCGICHP